LYMDQRSACSRGKSEKRDPSSSVRQIGSTKGSDSGGLAVVVVVVVVVEGSGWIDVLPPRGDRTLESFFGMADSLDGTSWPLLSEMSPPPRNRYISSISLDDRIPFLPINELREKAPPSPSESRNELTSTDPSLYRLRCCDDMEWSFLHEGRRSNGFAAYVHNVKDSNANTKYCPLYTTLL